MSQQKRDENLNAAETLLELEAPRKRKRKSEEQQEGGGKKPKISEAKQKGGGGKKKPINEFIWSLASLPSAKDKIKITRQIVKQRKTHLEILISIALKRCMGGQQPVNFAVPGSININSIKELACLVEAEDVSEYLADNTAVHIKDQSLINDMIASKNCQYQEISKENGGQAYFDVCFLIARTKLSTPLRGLSDETIAALREVFGDNVEKLPSLLSSKSSSFSAADLPEPLPRQVPLSASLLFKTSIFAEQHRLFSRGAGSEDTSAELSLAVLENRASTIPAFS